MQIVHAHQAEVRGASAHRPGGIRFLGLLQGEEGTPGNFQLAVVEADGYQAPRHRHDFDQLRIVLEGAFGYEAGLRQAAGTLGYFPAGTWYTQSSVGRSVTLLLQAGGPQGHGYMSDRQLRAAVATLQARGRFEDGIYTWFDDAGKKHNQDGYEAAWEQVHGRPIAYPRPRFDGPVLWQADRFPWQPAGEGAQQRVFGSFTEGGLAVSQLRLVPGCRVTVGDAGHEVLLCVTAGQALLDDQALDVYSSLRLAPGEQVTLRGAATEALAFVVRLMRHA